MDITLSWPGKRSGGPPVSSVRCTDGSWYIALWDDSGTWVFTWRYGETGQPIANKALIDGRGWLAVGENNTVQLWGFDQSKIVFVDINGSEGGPPFTPHPVQLQLYASDAYPLDIVSSKRCDDGSWYLTTFLADRRKSAQQGMWVFRWQNGQGPGQALFNQPLSPGNGWLEIGEDQIVQLWAIQETTPGTNAIEITDIGPLSGAPGTTTPATPISVNLPLYQVSSPKVLARQEQGG